MYRLLTAFALTAGLAFAAPRPDDPFFPDLTYADGLLTVTFDLNDPGEHIYDDMLLCSLGDALTKPEPVPDPDGRPAYEGTAVFVWEAKPSTTFTLEYQGCTDGQCLFPQTRTFSVTADGLVIEGGLPTAASATPGAAPAAPAATLDFPVAERTLTGYVEAEEFNGFLRGTRERTFADDPLAFVREHGMLAFVLLVFLGGLLLNLTPCVLPMIPINLAIIGAGAAGGSRLRGALRGGAYGFGIAVAYGLLALIPVLTGAAFGVIQSAWWFNAAIAVVFVLLALALFDVFMIDFTRFSGPGSDRKGGLAAFVAGAVSAVLAGACVAPVLIAVLLLTSAYVAEGTYWALCLPFVLGLGMALPWPIAGAGLSFLPKPGAWMVWVKKIFGVIVLLFALYYGFVAYRALFPATGSDEALAGAVEADASDPASVQKVLTEAKAAGKPVFVDFWGPACKNCELMEATTFRDADVQKTLEDCIVVKIRMDLADTERIETVRRAYNIQGLPTYLIIDGE